MSIPLLMIGLIQLTVGISMYNRSLKDIERVTYFIKYKPEKIINKPEIKDLIHINEKQFFSILDNLTKVKNQK